MLSAFSTSLKRQSLGGTGVTPFAICPQTIVTFMPPAVNVCLLYRVQVYSFSCLVLVLPVHQVGWCTAVQKLGVERPGVQRGRESVHPTESRQLTLRPASSSPPCYTGLYTTSRQQKKHQKVHRVYLLNSKKTESTLHTSVGNGEVLT